MHAVSVTDEEAVVRVAAQVGCWDVLVLSAGFMSRPSDVKKADLTEWWGAFEVCSPSSLPVACMLLLAVAGQLHVVC